jgi:hypothetical protein
MAVTQHASGTQAATISTEHFLGTDPETTAGAFQFIVDCTNMVRADSLEVRVYEKPTGSGDTAILVKIWPINNEQAEPLFVSPALMLLHGWRFSIKQTTGTGRSFKWSIRKAG